jgi:hypothetical protein
VEVALLSVDLHYFNIVWYRYCVHPALGRPLTEEEVRFLMACAVLTCRQAPCL